MERVTIYEPDLEFSELSERSNTDMIVIHHTGNPTDDDLSAEEIHTSHLAQGWAGIGYHFVIRKNGMIERGRPECAVGSHAYGENSHTIGIHVCGNFEIGTPTGSQIERLALLIANLCEDWGIPTDRDHIVGHRELMPTACPGTNLFAVIDTIVGKANWYRYNEQGENPAENKPIEETHLSNKPIGTSQNFVSENTQETAINKGFSGEPRKIEGEPRKNEELPEVKIWKFFKVKGLNDFAVAGIIGNLYAESGLISTNLQNNFEDSLGSDEEYTAKVDSGEYSKGEFAHDSAGYGLAQWTYYTRKEALYDYAKSKGVSIGDLDMQLEFLWSELIYYDGLMHRLRDAKSVREASDAFLLDFERPADQGEGQRSKRAGYSQEFYEDYAAKIEGDENVVVTEKRYNTVEELPEWAKGTIERMIAQGIIKGDGDNLDLSLDMIRTFMIVERWIGR